MTVAASTMTHERVNVGRKRRPPKKNPRTMRAKFAARLHEIAGDKSNRDIARACSVSDMAVSKWFSGEAIPDTPMLPALARCLGVKIYELFYPD